MGGHTFSSENTVLVYSIFSGLSISQGAGENSLLDVVAYSGSAYLYFYSDAAYNMTGFDMKWE